MKLREKPFQASILLFLTAVIWGGGFIAQRLAMRQVGPYLFNGFRFLLGAATLIPVMLIRGRRLSSVHVTWDKTIKVGIASGFFLFFGATFQQLGLVYTTAGKAGFITGLYILIVPLMGMIWGDRTPLQTWFGAVLAVGGLYFLSMTSGFKFAPGDGFVLVGAFFWAGQIQLLAKYAPHMNAIRLSFVQALFASLTSFGVGLIWETFDAAALAAAFWPIIYGGVISIGVAYTMQVIAQQITKPTTAAILLSLESVFAAFWGWIFLKEILSPRALVGSALILTGIVLSQIRVGSKTPING